MSKRWIDYHGGIVELAQRCAATVASWYHCSSAAERVAGARWYYDAHCQAAALALDYHLPSTRAAAGVIAALSPQQPWSRNVDIARALLDDTLRSVHYPCQIDKALRCAELSERDSLSDILLGSKELSFALNIADPTDKATVTVDGFSAQLALGSIVENKARAAYTLRLAGVYTAVADSYRAVAQRYGVLPSTVQATTWLRWRVERGIQQR